MHSLYSKKCSWLRGTVSQARDTGLTPGQVLLSNGPTRVQIHPGLQGEDELGPLSLDSTEVRVVTFKGVSTSLFHALFRKALSEHVILLSSQQSFSHRYVYLCIHNLATITQSTTLYSSV